MTRSRRRDRRTDHPAAVGFWVERSTGALGNNFVPVIVYANGAEFRHVVCVCLDQAASTATRYGTRPIPFLGVRQRRGGELTDLSPDLTCTVDPNKWTWRLHGHTHGTLAPHKEHPMTVTLTSFKRAIRVGDRFETTRQDCRPELVGTIRTITGMTGGYVRCTFEHNDVEGVMYWPKARDVLAVTDDEITFRITSANGKTDEACVTLQRVS